MKIENLLSKRSAPAQNLSQQRQTVLLACSWPT